MPAVSPNKKIGYSNPKKSHREIEKLRSLLKNKSKKISALRKENEQAVEKEREHESALIKMQEVIDFQKEEIANNRKDLRWGADKLREINNEDQKKKKKIEYLQERLWNYEKHEREDSSKSSERRKSRKEKYEKKKRELEKIKSKLERRTDALQNAEEQIQYLQDKLEQSLQGVKDKVADCQNQLGLVGGRTMPVETREILDQYVRLLAREHDNYKSKMASNLRKLLEIHPMHSPDREKIEAAIAEFTTSSYSEYMDSVARDVRRIMNNPDITVDKLGKLGEWPSDSFMANYRLWIQEYFLE